MSEENDFHNGGTNKETGAPTQKGLAHSLTASEHKNSDSKEGSAEGKGKEMKLPETTIRRIDKEKGDFEGKSSNEICRDIIEKYNEKPGNKDANYTEASLLEDLRDQESMELLVYRQKKSKTHAIEKLLESEENGTGIAVSYIFFIFVKGDNATDNTKPTENKATIKIEGNMETPNTKKSNIYCLTYGDAHNVIRGFEDTKFPRDVSKYVAKEEIRSFNVRHLRGTCYNVHRFYRDPTKPDRLDIRGVVKNFQGRVDPFLERFKVLEVGTKGTRLEISRNGVRFMKELTMEGMRGLIEELDDDKVKMEGGGCEIMDYVLEVEDQNTIEKLEEKLFDKILEYVIKGLSGDATDNNDGQVDPHPYDVMYKDFELHMKGKDFQFHLPHQRTHTKTEELGSFDDVVRRLRNYLKNALSRQLRLVFTDDGKEIRAVRTFFTCLHGKFDNYSIKAGKIEGSDGKEIQEDVMQNLETKLVARILKDMTKDNVNGELKFYSIYKGKQLQLFRFPGRVKEKVAAKDYSDALKILKSYLAKHLQIRFNVNGEEKEDLMLNYFHGEVVLDYKEQEDGSKKQGHGSKKQEGGSRIYHKVDGRWFEIEDQYNELLKSSFQTLILRKFKDDTTDNISLYKGWPIDVGEGAYNDSYKKEVNFYVGDKIMPRGIELCDIMKVLENEIHLYHVKEGFGQSTRDACSQIRNSASQVYAARQGDGNYLKEYYKAVTGYNNEEEYRKIFRTRLLDIGESKFLNWFSTKKIVFVYAFGNKIKVKEDGSWSEDKKLKDYKDKNVDKFSRSTIARHELHDTNLCLERQGFGFAICQIVRSEAEKSGKEEERAEKSGKGKEKAEKSGKEEERAEKSGKGKEKAEKSGKGGERAEKSGKERKGRRKVAREKQRKTGNRDY